MVSKRNSPEGNNPTSPQSREPVRVGDVAAMLFKIGRDEKGQFKAEPQIDLAAEHERKLQVVERLTDVTRQVLGDEIAKAQAGEAHDPQDIKDLQGELIDLTARREELRGQLPEPPEQP
ncbi:MAG: hypothetical protein ACREGB_01335 [Candidatus Saccharimonadales bacterium]